MTLEDIDRYYAVGEEIKKLKEEQDNIKANIKLQLEAMGQDMFENDHYKITNFETKRTGYKFRAIKEA